MGMGVIKCVVIDMRKTCGASLDANVDRMPAFTKGTTSIKLFGMAKKATTIESEALELRAEGVA